VETRALTYCLQCETFWFVAGEAAACVDATHDHVQHEVHHHRDVVTLPDGTPVTAVSFDAAAPYARDRMPDFGLYLDRRWDPPWPHAHVDWPDFGVPADASAVIAALGALLELARAGEHVEVGCLGGHGRTGTALACLAVLAGATSDDAVAWVRATYCDHAVERAEQETFVINLAG